MPNQCRVFERYFTLTPELALIATPDGLLQRINPAWDQTLGYSGDDLQGTPITSIVHPEDHAVTLAGLAECVNGHKITGFTNRSRHKDGSYRSIEWQILASENRSIVYATGRDITERLLELKKIAGTHIRLDLRSHANGGRVMAEPAKIHQMLTNLVANARDAMPAGGRLTIETAQIGIDEEFILTHPEARKGAHVLVTVEDTGTGMDGKTRENIFVPFFMTPKYGQGSGLGLATVYGIVHHLNGWIELESEPGQGATFRIYLPCAGNPESEAPGSGRAAEG